MRFQGNALYAMVGITAGTVLNIGLAPLLIFVFNMGIAGAAWATLCGQVCSFFILLYMDSRGENIRIRLRNFTPRFAYFREIIYGGSPSLCRQGLASLAAILLNVRCSYCGHVYCRPYLHVYQFLSHWVRAGIPTCMRL